MTHIDHESLSIFVSMRKWEEIAEFISSIQPFDCAWEMSMSVEGKTTYAVLTFSDDKPLRRAEEVLRKR